jgi:hypothetical protein
MEDYMQLGCLTLEYGGETLSTATGELRTVGGARLFKTSYLSSGSSPWTMPDGSRP